MPYSSKEFVERINKVIAEKKLKKKDFYSEIPSGTFSAWKTTKQIPRANAICKVAEFLDTSLDYLLLGKEPTSLNEDQKLILEAFELLNENGKRAALNLVRGLVSDFPRIAVPDGESSKTAT